MSEFRSRKNTFSGGTAPIPKSQGRVKPNYYDSGKAKQKIPVKSIPIGPAEIDRYSSYKRNGANVQGVRTRKG
jgi:hypothetical protein